MNPSEIGPYAIERELGRGAMGVVYFGRHRELGRQAAIKLLLEEEATTEARARFQRECEALARLGEHPGIVRLYDHGVHEGRPYVSLEFASGASLEESLARSGTWEVEPTLKLGLELCAALEFVHQAGVLHRDLKPANVLLDEAGRGRLTDFGLAKDVDAESLTQTGQLLGTPAYMPPEQASGDRGALGPASDVYGLGATLFRVLTGQPPFTGQTLANIVTQVFTKPPPTPSSLRPELSPALDAVLLRCLAKDPHERFASAAELGAALQDVLEGKGPAPARARGPALIALGSLALVVVAVAGLALRSSQEAAASPSASQALSETEARRRAVLSLGRATTEAELRTWLDEHADFAPERVERARTRLAELSFEAFQAAHQAAEGGPKEPPAGQVERIARHLALRAWAKEHLELAPHRIKTEARRELSDPGPRLLGLFRHPDSQGKNQFGLFPSDEELQLYGLGRPSPSWNLRTGAQGEVDLLPASSYVRRLIPDRRGERVDFWALDLRNLCYLREGRPHPIRLDPDSVGRDFLLLEDHLLIVGSRPARREEPARARGFAALVPKSAFRPSEEALPLTPADPLLIDNIVLCVVDHPRLQTHYAGGGAWIAAEGSEFMLRLGQSEGKLTLAQEIALPGTVESIAISPEGARLAVGLNRGGARVYPLDPETGEILTERHTRLVPTGKAYDPRIQTRGLRFLSDGRLLMTSKFYDSRKLQKEEDKPDFVEEESTLSLWSVPQQEAYLTPQEHARAKANPKPAWAQDYPFWAYEFQVSPDEALIALGTESFRVVVVAVPESP